MTFGRKGLNKAAGAQSDAPVGPSTNENARADAPPGHRNVLELLDREEGNQPHQRTQLAGKIVFDAVCSILNSDRGVRIEDLIAALSATGGLHCAFAAREAHAQLGAKAHEHDVVSVAGKDGLSYIFGNLPNQFLLESQFALLSLAMGMAQECGAQVSLDQASAVMGRLASCVGTPAFAQPDLPANHKPFEKPPTVALMFLPKLNEALQTYEVPTSKRPETMGFALQKAFELGKAAIDPNMAIRIAVEYAVPAARMDPRALLEWDKAYGFQTA